MYKMGIFHYIFFQKKITKYRTSVKKNLFLLYAFNLLQYKLEHSLKLALVFNLFNHISVTYTRVRSVYDFTWVVTYVKELWYALIAIELLGFLNKL